MSAAVLPFSPAQVAIVEAAAVPFYRTPAGMAARIQEIVETPLPVPHGALTIEEMQRRRYEVDDAAAELFRLRRSVATEFGAARGWRLGTDFGPEQLARRGLARNRRNGFPHWPRDFADHATAFRDPHGRAAALVGQPYRPTTPLVFKAAAREWAVAYGLRVSFPDDFPSWWVPDATILVLFEPGVPEERNRWHPGRGMAKPGRSITP